MGEGSATEAQTAEDSAKMLFDLDPDDYEATQGEIRKAIAENEEKVRVFNDWYAHSDSMTDPATFPSFEVEVPKELVDYYNEVGVFDHEPGPEFDREVTADRYVLGSNKARTIDQLIWILSLSICDYACTAGPGSLDILMIHLFPPLMGSWLSATAGLAVGRVLDTLRFYMSHSTTCPYRNRAYALMENWASTFQKSLNPSDEVMLALCSAAWPTPNHCALLDWKQWRAEFNREVTLMQQKEPCSIFEGRTIEDTRTRIQMRRDSVEAE